MQSSDRPGLDTRDAAAARLHLESFPDGVHVLVFPNRSLTHGGLFMAAGLCAAMTLPALVYAALIGAWPMLPFLGLELVVVSGAFVHLHRHHDDCEEIVISDEQVVVRRQHGRQRASLSFPRYWVRLVVDTGDQPRRSPRLWLRSHGHSEELSRDASAATRQALAWTLAHELGIPTASH